MANFWKDMHEANKMSRKATFDFIKKHPIGYGCLLIGSCAAPFAPLGIEKVKNKIKENKKNKEANLKRRMETLEHDVAFLRKAISLQADVNDRMVDAFNGQQKINDLQETLNISFCNKLTILSK